MRRWAVCVLLFFCLESGFATAGQAAIVNGVSLNPDFKHNISDEAVAKNLKSILDAAPSLRYDLPELNNALERQYKPFGQFKKDYLENNSLLQSKELKAVLASPTMKSVCTKMAPFLREVMSKHYAEHEIVPKTITHMNELLSQTNMVQMIAKTDMSGDMSDHVTALLGVEEDTATAETTPSTDWKSQGVTSWIPYREIWQDVMADATKLASSECLNTCKAPASAGEIKSTQNLDDMVNELHRHVHRPDETVFNFGDDGQTCDSTFGPIACCRQPWLGQCRGCTGCTEPRAPVSECDEVRQYMGSCLFSNYDECHVRLPDSPVHGMKSCEDGLDGVKFECPLGYTLKFQSLNYGRTSTTDMLDCHIKMRTDVTCPADTRQLEMAKTKCDGKRTCSLSDSDFPDPCPGVSKYFDLTYQCIYTVDPAEYVKTLSLDDLKSPDNLFHSRSLECMCQSKSCPWERLRDICRTNPDCSYCSTGSSGKDKGLFSDTFWATHTCPNNTFIEFHISPALWAGLAMLILGFVIYQLKSHHLSSATSLSRDDFSRLFDNKKTINSVTLASTTHMDEYFARALIRKITGTQAELIDVDKLFIALDKDNTGLLDKDAIADGLYRSLRKEEADRKALLLIRVGSGEIPRSTSFSDGTHQKKKKHRELTITSNGSAKWKKMTSHREKVPSTRHLRRLL